MTAPSTVEIARKLATWHPSAKLPCPVCAASLNAENLDKHLAKVHREVAGAVGVNAADMSDASGPVLWRGKGALGLFPCSVGFYSEAFCLRHLLGLGLRVIIPPCTIEIGSLWSSRPDVIAAQHDVNAPSVDVRAGRYLRLVDPHMKTSITIACRQSTQFTAHWDRRGWTEGGKRCAKDITVSRDAMVAIEYELARRRLLSPV